MVLKAYIDYARLYNTYKETRIAQPISSEADELADQLVDMEINRLSYLEETLFKTMPEGSMYGRGFFMICFSRWYSIETNSEGKYTHGRV